MDNGYNTPDTVVRDRSSKSVMQVHKVQSCKSNRCCVAAVNVCKLSNITSEVICIGLRNKAYYYKAGKAALNFAKF